jgi:predicted nucleic acid-binding Zn ribbon protein
VVIEGALRVWVDFAAGNFLISILPYFLFIGERSVMEKKRPSNDSLKPLGQVLASILDQCRSKNAGGIAHLAHIWQQTIGAPIADNAKPYAMKESLLLVNVSSSVWLHQLQFLKNELIDCLNRELEEGQIADIKFKIGPV